MSDNGPWYGGSSGGFKGMKATTWEGGIRVPFMVQYPKVLPENTSVDVPCWSPDIFPTVLALAGITPSKTNKLDGQNITEILQGKSESHSPVFSMHNSEIMSIRKGDYKLFIKKPRYNRLPADWVDPRGPDGITILAQMEQATPDQYPGIIPEMPENEIQLFNLRKDPTESTDLAKEYPALVDELMNDYLEFEESLQK